MQANLPIPSPSVYAIDMAARAFIGVMLKSSHLPAVTLVSAMIHGAVRIPIKDAPPTVKVFFFFSIKKAIIFAAGRQVARSRVNKDKLAISGVDNDPIIIRNMQTAN